MYCCAQISRTPGSALSGTFINRTSCKRDVLQQERKVYCCASTSTTRCNVSPSPTDVSPTENSWMLHPLDNVSLGYFAPDRTIPSLNSDWIERSDTRLPTAARFSAAKRWSSMWGPSVHPKEGRQSNKPGQGRRRNRPDPPLIH